MANKSGRETDPLVGYQYRIEVSGSVKLTGYFTEVSGIGSETEVIENKVTGPKGEPIVQKLPGRMKWQDVVLKRGITADMQLWQWRAYVEKGDMKSARSNCSIIMLDLNGQDVARWDFVQAWPTKVSGPTVKSDSNEFGVEEMTITHEGMIRKT
jgi:phage tail-like protein